MNELTLRKRSLDYSNKITKGSLANQILYDEIRFVKAKKNYRCCGTKCNNIIRKGTMHLHRTAKFNLDSFYRACSIGCALNSISVQESSDLTVRPNNRMKFAKGVSETSVLKLIKNYSQFGLKRFGLKKIKVHWKEMTKRYRW